MKNVIVVLAGGILVVGLGALVFFGGGSERSRTTLATQFSYAESELEELSKLSSREAMAFKSIRQWDETVFALVSHHKLSDAYASRIYAYLAAAQKDAAFLSYNAKGRFEGTFDSVSREVLCSFFPEDCKSFYVKEDEYSNAVARIIARAVTDRMGEERDDVAYPLPEGPEYWKGPQPSVGITTKGWKPWFLSSADQFLPPAPPDYYDPAMDAQLARVKEALASITEQQKLSVVFWAGGAGTKTPPGQWLAITDEYLEEKNVPLERALQIRSAVTQTVADAMIAVFNAKYAYMVPRPFMRDPSIITVMPTPNHPSYPAGHATLSAAAAAMLSYYIPEEAVRWNNAAREAGEGRTWGGIHFPMDNEVGFELGNDVAAEAIRKLSSQ